MGARVALEPISVKTGISDHRPRGGPELQTPAPSKAPTDHTSAEIAVAAPAAPAAEPPPLPAPSEPGTNFVIAVLAGALAPRPTSMQEVSLRTGTGWLPPDSDYRLTDKKI
jgi:hypothetical protein